MRRFARFAPLLLAVAVYSASAQTLQDGRDAIARGEFERAARILFVLAEDGNPYAQRMVGELIFQGRGVKQDDAAAYAWMKLAGRQGDQIAQYNLGYMFENGRGVGASLQTALEWYERSAQKDYVLAQRRLGELYLASDPTAAVHWLSKAKSKGDEFAEGTLEKAQVNKAQHDLEVAQAEQRSFAEAQREERKWKQEQDRQRRQQEIAARAYGAQVMGEVIAEQQRANRVFNPSPSSTLTLQSNKLPSPNRRADSSGSNTTDEAKWRETCGGMCSPGDVAKMRAAAEKLRNNNSCDAVRAAGDTCNTQK